MTDIIIETIQQLKTGNFEGTALEQKEFLLLQELCGSDNISDVSTIVTVLGEYGTILSIPVLCGILEDAHKTVEGVISDAIAEIRKRVKARGSFMPDVFFTPKHWRPVWLGTNNGFLIYVQVIADSYLKFGFDESETNRIGQILADIMCIDMAPYNTFADFRMFQTGWDRDAEYKLVLDRIAEERLLDELEKEGIPRSYESALTCSLMDLEYDYLIARLKLKGNMEYYRFVFKVAEALNEIKE